MLTLGECLILSRLYIFVVLSTEGVLWSGLSYIHYSGIHVKGDVGRKDKTCYNIKVDDSFKSSKNGMDYKINHALDCNFKCVTYLFTCKVCSMWDKPRISSGTDGITTCLLKEKQLVEEHPVGHLSTNIFKVNP